jgi:hypothetical protein
MTLEEFEASLAQGEPPRGLSPYLVALWYERRGDWQTAHEIVQDFGTREAAAVHAYLHRREGDAGNAQYWYRRAGKRADLGLALDVEWGNLVQEMLP